MGRWHSLQEMREAYAASGLELAKKHPQCRGKIRHAAHADAELHRQTLIASGDEHRARMARLGIYACRWCEGYHIGHDRRPPGRRPRRRRRPIRH